MTAEKVKQALLDPIRSLTAYKWLFSRNPQKDNTRTGKIRFDKGISAVLSFRGDTLDSDLLDFFGLDASTRSVIQGPSSTAAAVPGLLENALSLRTSAHAGVAIPRIFKHLGRKTKLFPSNRGAATPVTSVTGSQRHTFLTAP